ncbi:MAG TPA: YccF domain-containing protein [Anaerolineae bacterium]|nr:YccF domain-containing protein [Anaerolineae bacterium]HPL26423.1 YccF domain-containing protein [Anaerolineae bacterium]
MVMQPHRPFLVRALYFVLIGWWLAWLWINGAWVLIASVIGLPLGLWMLNRVPQVLTLKPMAVEAEVRGYGPYAHVRTHSVNQPGWLVRLIYFLLIGWWLSLVWANVAWALCVSIIGLPLGVIMFNYLPAVTTLMRTA